MELKDIITAFIAIIALFISFYNAYLLRNQRIIQAITHNRNDIVNELKDALFHFIALYIKMLKLKKN